ncbi:MAG: hypothetical protein IT385_18325 [Deltaproteobacteria bacterium]|nr:hypothetical protein [Deltaproteobacteria bacterium]
MADARDRPSTRRPWRSLRKVLGASASSATNLGVAGTAAIAAAALASWPVAAIGGLAYGALVAWDVSNDGFWKKVLRRGDAALPTLTPDRRLDPGAVRDKAIADAVRAIVHARAGIAATLDETPDEVRANLTGAVLQVEELQRLAALMVTRGDDVAAYLATVDRKKIHAEVAAIEAKLAATRDPEARRQYEEARDTKLGQERSLIQIGDQYDRILAKLTLVGATLEALPPKIVRMRALDAAARDELSGNVSDELAQMNGDIKVFEETLESLAEVPSL